jgi:ribose transport system permease protein
MIKNKNIMGKSIADEFTMQVKKLEHKAVIMQLLPIGLLISLIILFGLITPQFLTFSNLYSNVLTQMSVLLVTSMGATFVILIGGIDLSVEGMVGFAGCLVGLLVQNSKNDMNLGWLGVIIAILLTAMIGYLMGLIHIKLRLPSFIVTFCMGYVAYGLGVLTYKGLPASITDQALRDLYFVKILELPLITWVAFFVLIIALFLEKKTAFGRYVFAVGNNERIPMMSGVNVSTVKIKVFTFAGFCLGVAGVMGAAKLGTAQIYIGQDLLFPTLTAVIVGGTSMSGGSGGVLNTLIGVLIVTVLQNGMVMIGVPTEWQQCVQGLIIISMVVLSRNKSLKQIVK